MTPERQSRPRPNPRMLALAACWGAGTATIAYVVGRGSVVGMVIVFAVIGIGVRVWAHWYRRRHPRP
ncbi:MAG: hypothetical protein ACYDH6_22580 [Acidimicrobiales bacterium]